VRIVAIAGIPPIQDHFQTFLERIHDFRRWQDHSSTGCCKCAQRRITEETMQPFKGQPVNRPLRVEDLVANSVAAFTHLVAFFAAILRHRTQRHDAGVIAGNEGQGWCDATERQIIDDIANYRRTQF
jgi:hypothetical protein